MRIFTSIAVCPRGRLPTSFQRFRSGASTAFAPSDDWTPQAAHQIPEREKRPHPADLLFGEAAFPERADGKGEFSLPKHARVVNSMRRDQVIRGAVVERLDEDGKGVVNIFSRRDKQAYEFTFERTLPGEKLHLLVSSAKWDRYNKKVPGKYRLAVQDKGGASQDEVTPECSHFDEGCGGCVLQNLAHSAQLREKLRLLEISLAQYGLPCETMRAVVPSRKTFGFHSRMEFKFFARGGLQLGLHPGGSPVPLVVTRCMLMPPACHRAFEALLAAARADREVHAFDPRTGQGHFVSATLRAANGPDGGQQVLLSMVTTPDAPIDALRRLATSVSESCADVVGITWSPIGAEFRGAPEACQHRVLHGRPFLVQHICGERIETVPEGFIRPNIWLAEALYETVLELADVRPEDTVWDAFCGQGPLPTLLARRCKRLLALDSSNPALAGVRARLAGVAQSGCRAEARHADLSSMEQLLTLASEDAPDVVVADPGRKGMPKAFRSALCRVRARRIVYVGSGRSLLRDCALLAKRGYELAAVVPFDTHPHAPQLEVVAQLCFQGDSEEHVA